MVVQVCYLILNYRGMLEELSVWSPDNKGQRMVRLQKHERAEDPMEGSRRACGLDHIFILLGRRERLTGRHTAYRHAQGLLQMAIVRGIEN